MPQLARTSLPQQQQAAISANLAAMPGAKDLVGQANIFSRDQINQMLSSVIPDFQGITATASSNIASMLRGEVPSDVSTAVQNSAAARALGGGYAGSGMGRNLVARDLGLTSLDLTQRGLSSAQSWMTTMNSIYQPSMMNLASMFISPEQMYATENEQNIQQFQRQWMQEQINSMPDPVTRGIQDSIAEVGMAFLGGSHTPYYQNASPGQRVGGGVGAPLTPNYGDGGMDFAGPGMNYNPYADTAMPGMDFAGGGGGGDAFGQWGVGPGF